MAVVLLNPSGQYESVEDAASALEAGYSIPEEGVETSRGTVYTADQLAMDSQLGSQVEQFVPTIGQAETVAENTTGYDKVSSFSQGVASGLTAGLLGESDYFAAARSYNPGYNTAGEVTGIVGGAVVGGALGGAKSVGGGVAGLSAELGNVAGKSVAKYGKIAQYATEGAVDGLAYATARETIGAVVRDDPFSIENIANDAILGAGAGGAFGAAATGLGVASKGLRKLDDMLDGRSGRSPRTPKDPLPEVTAAQAEYAHGWSVNMRQQAENMSAYAGDAGEKAVRSEVKRGLSLLDKIDEVMVGGSTGSQSGTFASRLSKLSPETSKKIEAYAIEANDIFTKSAAKLDVGRFDPMTASGRRASAIAESGDSAGMHYPEDTYINGMDKATYSEMLENIQGGIIRNDSKQLALAMGDRELAGAAALRARNRILRDPAPELLAKESAPVIGTRARLPGVAGGKAPSRAGKVDPLAQIKRIIASGGEAQDVRIPLDLILNGPQEVRDFIFKPVIKEGADGVSVAGLPAGHLSPAQLADLQGQLDARVVKSKPQQLNTAPLFNPADVPKITPTYSGGDNLAPAGTMGDVSDSMGVNLPPGVGALAGTLIRSRVLRGVLGSHFGGLTGLILSQPAAAARVAEAAAKAVSYAPVRRAARVSLSTALFDNVETTSEHETDKLTSRVKKVAQSPDVVHNALMDNLVNVRGESMKLTDDVMAAAKGKMVQVANMLQGTLNQDPSFPDTFSPSQRFHNEAVLAGFLRPEEVMANLAVMSKPAVDAVKQLWPEKWFQFSQAVLEKLAESGQKPPPHIAMWFPATSPAMRKEYVQIAASVSMSPVSQAAPDPGSAKPSLQPTINQQNSVASQEV